MYSYVGLLSYQNKHTRMNNFISDPSDLSKSKKKDFLKISRTNFTFEINKNVSINFCHKITRPYWSLL